MKFGKQHFGEWKSMKVGDLVQIRPDSKHFGLSSPQVPETPGIIVDFMTDNSGYELALVYFQGARWWMYKTQLDIVNDV